MAAKAITITTITTTNTTNTAEPGYEAIVEAVWKAMTKGERL